MLIGSGVGAFHGPWIKVGGKDKRWEEATPEEVVDSLTNETSASIPPDANAQAALPSSDPAPPPPIRKKPRKIEVRSKHDNLNTPAPDASGGVRRPRKLEMRSPSKESTPRIPLDRQGDDSGYAEEG